jgi:hypothetical protein
VVQLDISSIVAFTFKHSPNASLLNCGTDENLLMPRTCKGSHVVKPATWIAGMESILDAGSDFGFRAFPL